MDTKTNPHVLIYGDKQVQLQGLENDDIWAIRIDDNGNILFQNPGNKATQVDRETALEFATKIIEICKYNIVKRDR